MIGEDLYMECASLQKWSLDTECNGEEKNSRILVMVLSQNAEHITNKISSDEVLRI